MAESRAWEIKEGDLEPSYEATLKENGVVVDLTDAVGVQFRMRQITGAKVVLAAGELADRPGGKVRYRWVLGNTDTPDLYHVEWAVTWTGGRQQTFPNEGFNSIRVVKSLG